MSTLVPKGDALRHAIAWLAEHHGTWTPELVDEACRRFDIAPVDEEFLLAEWRRARDAARHRDPVAGGAPTGRPPRDAE